MQQPHRRGVWIEEKTLGSGGFGTVVLWKNEENGDYLALKTCRVQNEMTAKHRSRWTLEVDIMKRLDHPNVIRALNVPPELDVKKDELPLLAMEYCSGGDLRKVLNKPENCCGLKEYDLRCLLRDVSSAVEYLHGKRIIHRDLKPENIVLYPSEERVLYKLIDLGYAKELDQGSVCTSFVGTLQYLAPELYASQKYTCTVDYWSFGTLVFECVTGTRPFLPQTPPVQWHKEISHKSPEDICAFFDINGDVKFSKKLLPPNHLCRTMQSYFEHFLQLMLRWDNRQRGGGLMENRPRCFTYLDNMLNLQIYLLLKKGLVISSTLQSVNDDRDILFLQNSLLDWNSPPCSDKCAHILHVTANQLLTYPLYNINTMYDLQRVIEAETRIKIDEQDILLASGASPDPELAATQCWASPGEEDWVVFLFKKGEVTEQPKKFKTLPARIQNIVKDQTTLLPYQEQKKAWAEAVFFCAEQVLDFRRLILSQRAAMLSLLRTNSSFLKLKSKMVNSCDHLMAKIQYFKESLQHDIELYKSQASNGGVSSDKMYRKWLQIGEQIDLHQKLKERCNMLDQQSTALQTKIVELQRSPFARTKQNEILEEMEKKSKDLYQELRQAGRGGREIFKDHSPIVGVVVKCVMARDKSLADLYTHLGKICSCKHELFQILPDIQACIAEIEDASQKLIGAQKGRQTDVWTLLKIALQGNNNFSRQDSRGNQPLSNGHSSMLSSMCGEAAAMSMQVVEESKGTQLKFDEIVRNLRDDHEQMLSLMDWSFLSSNQKES